MQLCMMRDDRSWRRRPAVRLRPNGASTHGRGVTGLRVANLQSCGQLQSNGTGAANLQSCGQLQSNGTRRRCVDAALLRLVEAAVQPRPNGAVLLRRFRLIEAASIASLNMLRLGAAAPTGLCCSFEPAQSKKVPRTKPTLFSASLPRPGDAAV